VQEWPGKLYKVQIELPVMDHYEAEEWIAFLLSLNGPVGKFWLGPSEAQEPPVAIQIEASPSSTELTNWDNL
jgi:hypothetical protein